MKQKTEDSNIQKEIVSTTSTRYIDTFFQIAISEKNQEKIDELDEPGKRAFVIRHIRLKPKTFLPDGKEGQYFQEALYAFLKIL